MRTLLMLTVTGCFLSACAAVWPTTHDTLYFHTNKEGTRYYALSGNWTIRAPDGGEFLHVPDGMLWVTREGEVYTNRGRLASSVTKDHTGEWDLRVYSIEQPSGYCIPLWSPKIARPESCWNRLWEVPSMMWILGLSALAVL